MAQVMIAEVEPKWTISNVLSSWMREFVGEMWSSMLVCGRCGVLVVSVRLVHSLSLLV